MNITYVHTCIPRWIRLAVKMFTLLNFLGESNLKINSIGLLLLFLFQLIHPSSKYQMVEQNECYLLG